MKKLLQIIVLCLVALPILSVAAGAATPLRQVPVTIATTLLPGKIFTFSFNLYTAASGGTKVWGPASAKLTVAADKTIAYTLGAKPVFGPAVNFTQQMWLQVTGGGKTWRVPLGAAPYALWSAIAEESITTVQILNGSIFDEDIADSAAIADTKLAQIASAGKVADSALSSNVELLNGTGLKTFNPTGETVPFAVDATKTGLVTNLNADLLDGDHGDAFQRKYGRVAVVAKSGGDYDDPYAAMTTEALAEWCPSPTADAPCLLKIMPGVYDIGAGNSVHMQPYVDLEGSGEKTTKIKGSIGADAIPTPGVLRAADGAEVRFLSVENVNTTSALVAGIRIDAGSPSLLHVTATATGGTSNNYGIVSTAAAPASPSFTHVTASSLGGGTNSSGIGILYALGATLTDVTASASGGSTNNSGISVGSSIPGIVMKGVTATGTGGVLGRGIQVGGSSTVVMTNVTATAMDSTADNTAIYLNPSAVATMANVVASAKGVATTNIGVRLNDSATATMTNVTTSASGSGSQYGAYSSSSSSAVMTDVTASASGTGWQYGAYFVNSSSAVMTNVTASASGGSGNTGIGAYGAATMTNVVASAKDGTSSNKGVALGIGGVEMTNVTATAAGGSISYGIDNIGATVLTNVTARATGGTSNYGLHNDSAASATTVVVNRSSFEGSTAAIHNVDADFTVAIGGSMLYGSNTVDGVGAWNCVASYLLSGAAFVALDAGCQLP